MKPPAHQQGQLPWLARVHPLQAVGTASVRVVRGFGKLAAAPHVLRWAWWALCAAALFFGLRYFRYTTRWIGSGWFMSTDRVSGQACFYRMHPTAPAGSGYSATRDFCTDARPPDVPWPESSVP